MSKGKSRFCGTPGCGRNARASSGRCVRCDNKAAKKARATGKKVVVAKSPKSVGSK